ncbi:nucleosidase [uncultured Bacteroides sp.]|uniref:5'-methylthioadenosine/S-adenosylhomocysteine nucleosidase family protein n=1 Tax=uncultured Bacteroides sp. TaxID=162156 RepID=UPI002AABD656|nr:nucleosidase [uncultured Bacteroides sp.]
MLKVLVTFAVKEELVEINWPDAELYYLRTGIGKVKSAFRLADAINQVQPDLVLNFGTAGTIKHQVGDILVCRKFVDRDMQKIKDLGLECEIDSSELLTQKDFCAAWGNTATCNTGDSFLTELVDVDGDAVDMEAFAQAFVCRDKEVPFISVKYVTDVIGQNSVAHWEDKLADARMGLSEFFNVLHKGVQ